MNKIITSSKLNSTFNLINIKENINLDIRVLENDEFTLNIFSCAKDITIKINVESGSNSRFTLNNSFINDYKYFLEINSNLNGNNIINNVNIRGINEKNGSVNIIMNGNAPKDSKDNIINEYAKIINKSKNSAILIPNLIIDTCDIVANHGVSIGSINEKEILYLQSKGISRLAATKIIESGYITNIMKAELKEKIKNILLGR